MPDIDGIACDAAHILRQTFREFVDDDFPSRAAALA